MTSVDRMHGAGNRNKGTAGGGTIMTGMYSDKVNTKLSEAYEQFLEQTDDVQALREDIALMRAMLVDTISEEADTVEEQQAQQEQFLSLMKDIRQSTDMKVKMEQSNMVTIETVQIFLNQLLYILKTNIKDEELLHRLVMQMQQVKILDQDKAKFIGTNNKNGAVRPYRI